MREKWQQWWVVSPGFGNLSSGPIHHDKKIILSVSSATTKPEGRGVLVELFCRMYAVGLGES